MIKFLVLIVVLTVACAPIARIVLRKMKIRRLEDAFRENPPEMVRFKVRLPREATKTNERMMRFLKRLDRLVPYDPDAIATGESTVHLTYLATATDPGQPPKLIYLIHCPAQYAAQIQRELQACYDDQAQVLDYEAKDDPFVRYEMQTREVRAWEEAQKPAKAERTRDEDDEDDE